MRRRAPLRGKPSEVPRTHGRSPVRAVAIAIARPGAEALRACPATPRRVPLDRSPEVDACRAAFRTLARTCTALAASQGNRERLHGEYRRASRRSRALSDALLPEADRRVAEFDTRLAELEQEDAIWRRPRR